MRMWIPRSSLALVVPILVLAAVPAWAEDDPAPGGPKPLAPAVELKAIRLPFTVDDLAPGEGARPQGWSAATVAMPAAAPSTGMLLRLAREAGVDGDKIGARCIPMSRGTAEAPVHGVIGFLTIGVEATTLTPKLQALATKHGWTTKNLAVPSAVMITWASDDAAEAALHTYQVETAVRNLCAKGYEAVTTARDEWDQTVARTKFAKGQAMVAGARDTLPEAGYVHAILAQLYGRDPAKVLAHGRKALRADAPVPPPASMRVATAFSVGAQLLTTGGKADLDEVVTVLGGAVAIEDAAGSPIHRFGNRYNLACAYARQGKLDPAFTHLEESLRYLKKAWLDDGGATSRLGYPNHYAHAKTNDTDMESLRADPRFAKLMATYHPDAKAPAKAAEGEK